MQELMQQKPSLQYLIRYTFIHGNTNTYALGLHDLPLKLHLLEVLGHLLGPLPLILNGNHPALAMVMHRRFCNKLLQPEKAVHGIIKCANSGQEHNRTYFPPLVDASAAAALGVGVEATGLI